MSKEKGGIIGVYAGREVTAQDIANAFSELEAVRQENEELKEHMKVEEDIGFTKSYHNELTILKLKEENEELKARLKNAVELPCKFGSSVYVLMQRGLKTDIVKSTVENIRRYSGDTWWVEFSSLWVDKTLDDFGKTVFLTREDAEKALKEREHNEVF